ncbi:MAG: polysaccharide deacetylase family protein, partial [Acidimicrobiales bacterium]
ILELLREHRATATFFLIGERAREHPELVRQICEDGHAIGNHSFSHTHPWKTAPWRSRSDVSRGDSTVRAASSDDRAGELLFRPPYGKLNVGLLPFLSRNTSWWSVDPRDYECETGLQVLDRVRPQLQSGEVVLLHDGRLGEQTGDVTVGAVRELLDYGAANGIRFEALQVQPG